MPSSSRPNRVVFLALQGAGEKICQIMLDNQRMPFLSTLVERGSWIPLKFPPPDDASESLWSTVATGSLADIHGILYPLETLAETPFAVPVASHSLKKPSLWTLADEAGIGVGLVGWPVTTGLALKHGWVVAPGCETGAGAVNQAWPLNPRSYYPEDMADIIHTLRVRPDEIDQDSVAHFIRHIPMPVQKYLYPIVANALSAQTTLHALGTHIALQHSPQVFTIRLDFIAHLEDAVIHYGCGSHALLMMEQAYNFIDALIGRYMNIYGEDATYVVVSGPSRSRMHQGFAVVSGPLFKPDHLTAHYNSIDLFPTLSHLLGIPCAPNEGVVIDEIFANSIKAVNTSLNQPLPPPPRQLIVTGGPSDIVNANTWLNLSKIDYFRGQEEQAISTLEKLVEKFPHFTTAKLFLAELLAETGQMAKCKAVVTTFPEVQKDGVWRDLAVAIMAYFDANWEKAFAGFRKLSDSPECPVNVSTWAGWCCVHNGQPDKAFEYFRVSVEQDPTDIRAWEGIATMYHKQGQPQEAMLIINRAISIAPRSSHLRRLQGQFLGSLILPS